MAEKNSFWSEFKTFIARGNVMDMAVGVVVGGAFTAIVNSLVGDIIGRIQAPCACYCHHPWCPCRESQRDT